MFQFYRFSIKYNAHEKAKLYINHKK